MKMADKLQDLRPVRMNARKAKCHQRGFGSRRCESDALRGRHQPLNEPAPFDFEFVAGAEMRALRDLLLNGRDHLRRAMPKHNGPVAVPEVDQFVTVNIPFTGAVSMSDING